MVHAHNSRPILHSLHKKFLLLASSFNMEKLLSIATCSLSLRSRSWCELPHRGWVTFFFRKKVPVKDVLNFAFDYNYLIF